jgi:hypothetical protein
LDRLLINNLTTVLLACVDRVEDADLKKAILREYLGASGEAEQVVSDTATATQNTDDQMYTRWMETFGQAK